MAWIEKFFEQAPKIIAEAAKSPLGIVALVILALSGLAPVLSDGAPVWVRVGIFAVLFLSFSVLAFAAMRRVPDVPEAAEDPARLAQSESQPMKPIVE